MKKQTPRALLWMAGGIAAGTALGWLTAPRRGDWLRNQIGQKVAHWRRIGRRRMAQRSRDVENRLRGTAYQARGLWGRRGHFVDANTLVDQVHSQLGREFAELLEHVNLNAVDRTIYLHGYVSSEAERQRLIRAIADMDCVEAVRGERLRVEEGKEGKEGKDGKDGKDGKEGVRGDLGRVAG